MGDISRFRNARLLTAYAGLVPSVHQSGESTRSGPITKEGSSARRSVVVQACQFAGSWAHAFAA
ncbi:MAG: transposase [Polyangiaceae bacterium]